MADRDVDLMEYVDGELAPGAAAEVEAAIAADPARRARVEGVREVSELVRGHLELAADAAEPRFERLWGEIEKRLEHETRPVAVAPRRPSSRLEDATPGLLGRVGRWLDRHRGHVLTGVVSAGAVAALALVLRGTDDARRTGGGGAIPAVPVVDRLPPEVESLETPEGNGTVFTIEDDDGDATVIWVTPEDTVEGL